MKWKLKNNSNDRCIVSDCGRYRISRYTLGGADLYRVFRGDQPIGDGKTGNEARKIALRHSESREDV